MLSSDELLLIHAIVLHRRLDLAARALQQSHSTAFRKLLALEQRLNGQLFVKARGEYRPTQLGLICANAAAAWLKQQQALTENISAQAQGNRQRLRLTTTEDIAMFWLPRCLEKLHQLKPELTIDVWIDERMWDLATTDADLAIRPTRRPPEGWVGLDLGIIEMAIYANAALAAKFHPADLSSVPWALRHPESGPSADHNWANAHIPEAAICSRWNRVSGLVQAVQSGLGAGLLPCFVGDALGAQRMQTVRLGSEPAKLWLLSHPDLRRDVRVKSVFAAARALGKIQRTN
jgi:DNA-binding transcriptional LysR family regulator